VRLKHWYILVFLLMLVCAGILFLSRHKPFPGAWLTGRQETARTSAPQPVPSQPDASGWEELFNGVNLNGWEVTNFGPQGPVYVSNGAVVLGMGDGCTGITWTGEVLFQNYEIELDAMRISGHDFFCALTFPVGEGFCTFIVGGWAGTVVGISNIDGRDASENSTTRNMVFEQQRWYHIGVRVTADSLVAWIDGERVVSVARQGHAFAVRPEVRLSRPLGICSWYTTAGLKNIRARSLVPGRRF